MSVTRGLFLLLGALALSVLLAQPLCGAAHPQMHAADAASCCHLLPGSVAKSPDFLTGTSGSALVPPASFAYLVVAALFLTGAIRFARAPAPLRSYYARSKRILR